MPLRAGNIDWRSALAHENCRVSLALFPVDYIFRLYDFGAKSACMIQFTDAVKQ